jgi:Na+/H+ antiporter NhaD/arsenite permease-like protein
LLTPCSRPPSRSRRSPSSSGSCRPRRSAPHLDLHLLSLFLVLLLVLAVERLKRSGLVETAVGRVLSRVSSERALAVAAVLTIGAVSAMVTNDVALLLVVPFPLALETVDAAQMRHCSRRASSI